MNCTTGIALVPLGHEVDPAFEHWDTVDLKTPGLGFLNKMGKQKSSSYRCWGKPFSR